MFTKKFKANTKSKLKTIINYVVLLPIKGCGKGVTSIMWGKESTKLAKIIKEKLIIPMHFNMFGFNIENPDGFMEDAHWKRLILKY